MAAQEIERPRGDRAPAARAWPTRATARRRARARARRRLALARALAVEPRVLLLDEPLAHLDPLARKTLRLELARLHRDLAVTTICATRDAADAMALSDRIAVMQGRPASCRSATPRALPAPGEPRRGRGARPRELPARAGRGGARARRGGRDEARRPGPRGRHRRVREGSRGLLVLRPETLSLDRGGDGPGARHPGQVSLRVFEGARYLYEMDIGAGDADPRGAAGQRQAMFRLGDRVRVEISSDTVVLLPDDARSRAGRRARCPRGAGPPCRLAIERQRSTRLMAVNPEMD